MVLLVGIVLAYAVGVTVALIFTFKRAVGTIHISFEKDGEVRMGVYDAIDPEDLAKKKLVVFRVKTKRE